MRPLPDSAAFLRRRAAERQRALAERAERALRDVESAAWEISERFGARRVVLFGSLARRALHERSDVDLAVWGMSARDEARAADVVTKRVGLPVDLIRMEAAPDSLRERAETEGVELVPGR